MCIAGTKYWSLFDKATVDAEGISDAMFILPNGKLKKLKMARGGAYIRPEHEYISFYGFDLDNLLASGVFRIGNNTYSKEVYIQARPTTTQEKKVLDVLEWCLLSYRNMVLDCTIEEPLIPYVFRYSQKNGDTIRDIKRDLNKLTNNKGYIQHVRYN